MKTAEKQLQLGLDTTVDFRKTTSRLITQFPVHVQEQLVSVRKALCQAIIQNGISVQVVINEGRVTQWSFVDEKFGPNIKKAQRPEGSSLKLFRSLHPMQQARVFKAMQDVMVGLMVGYAETLKFEIRSHNISGRERIDKRYYGPTHGPWEGTWK